MTIMSDRWIKEQCQGDSPMLSPFLSESVSVLPNGKNITSKGVSSYGYDLSLGPKFKLLKPRPPSLTVVIDPCNFDSSLLTDYDVSEANGGMGVFILPPHAFALGVTVERIRMPAGVFGICMEKSTCARAALNVTVTPIEPEWEGYLTLELHNKTEYPIVLTPGMGICQLLFFTGDQLPEVTYKDRAGKYQNQPASPVAATAKR